MTSSNTLKFACDNSMLKEGKDASLNAGGFSYPGDEKEVIEPLKTEGYQTLDFSDPAELVCFFNEPIASGQVTLHSWQTNTSELVARIKPTSRNPLKFCLVAANGSGKDAFIIAPFAIWFCLTKIQSRCIITSSSGTQLTAQTEGYIRGLAESVNKFFGCEYFRIRQRYITCRLTGSEIRMFATDEAGKAEGYHPMVPNAEMAIVINEWKSVTDEIVSALKRCTGYNYWLGVSTTGECKGSFYYAVTKQCTPIPLDNLSSINKPGNYTIRVTSYDCPHLRQEEIEEDKVELGEHSAFFRSKHLALFTSIGGDVIITKELLDKLLENPPAFSISSWPIRIGLDYAAGGDEDTICFTKGNKILKEIWFREADTTIAADRFERELLAFGIEKEHDYIWADDGGVGHGITDQLNRRGWKIKRHLNQWAAINKKQFGNRGAEDWTRVKRLFEEQLFDVSNLSDKTKNQLINRKYKQGVLGARIYLESKKEAKAHGRPSPDRADALVLALTGLTIDEFLKAKTTEGPEPVKHTAGEDLLKTEKEVTDYYTEKIQYGEYNGIKLGNRNIGKRIYNSLRQALKV
jgi:hypothetical protein